MGRRPRVLLRDHVEGCATPLHADKRDHSGLDADSDFSYKETGIERIMWLINPGRFLVEVEEFRLGQNDDCDLPRLRSFYIEILRRMIAGGWRVKLNTPKGCATADEVDEAEEYDPGTYPVIRIGYLYYSADRDEIEALRLQGEELVIVREGCEE